MTDELSTSESADLVLTPRRRRMFALITLALGIFTGLVAAEVGLRIAGFSSPEFYQADPQLGYALIPGMIGNYSKEGRSHVSINSDGFRDEEWPIAKLPGTTRIAVVGDSYVEAFQVERAQALPSVLESRLRQTCFAGKGLEVLAFGVSGYGTGQEMIMLREKVLKYSPDIVILLVTTNNDITDNARVFKRTPIPYFELTDGGLRLDESFRSDKVYLARASSLGRLQVWLRNNLRLVQAVGTLATQIKYRYTAWKTQTTDPQAETGRISEAGTDLQIYREPETADWHNAWSVTEALFKQMDLESSRSGARFIVATGSNAIQVGPDLAKRAEYATSLGIPDLLYPDRRIGEFCRTSGIDSVTLAPRLADAAARDGAVLHGFPGGSAGGHWNESGHRIAGEELALYLCQQSGN